MSQVEGRQREQRGEAFTLDCHEEDARRCRTRGHTSHDLANSSEGPTVQPARDPGSATDRTDLYRDPGEDNLLVRPSTGDLRASRTGRTSADEQGGACGLAPPPRRIRAGNSRLDAWL